MDENKYVKGVYTQIAQYFDHTRGYTWPWISMFISEFVPDNGIVYDLGCGNGRNMNSKRVNFIGLDNCANLLEICEKKGLNVIEGDVCELPFDNSSCDAIINIAVFHHLSTPERRLKSLQEMSRVCRKGGNILLSVWSKTQPKKTRRTFDVYGDTIVKWNQNGKIFERYYYIFQIDEIKQLFKDAGLSIISHDYDCGNEVFVLTPE